MDARIPPPKDLEKGASSGDAIETFGADASDASASKHKSYVAFQKLVGLRPLEDFDRPRAGWSVLWRGSFNNSRRPGLYQRAIDEEFRARIWYRVSSVILNALYVLQVVFAAIFTGLSFTGDRTLLTVLGIINTVIAGILALMKGQGLPNRLLKDRDHFRAIIAKIEDKELFYSVWNEPSTETDIGGFKLMNDVRDLESQYETAMREQLDNHPDMYVAVKPATTDKNPGTMTGDGTGTAASPSTGMNAGSAGNASAPA